MTTKAILNFVVALPCEANPIIAHFKLKKLSTALPVFANNDQTIHLIISGVGKIKTAMATTFLAVFTGNSSFLNVGIAGSMQFPIGQVILANKITEQSTGRHYYPFIPALKEIKQSALITYDVAQQDYPATGMIDMEASAFFQVASTFVTQEQIQVLKIISDNTTMDQQKITPEWVRSLVSDNFSQIESVANYLKELSLQEKKLEFKNELLSNFQNQWHFTYSQTMQLKEYLRRWNICLKDEDPFVFSQEEKSSANVIKKIMIKLEKDNI